jgi:hypothetical protein
VFVFVESHDEIECKTSSNEREIIAEKEMKRRLIGK